VLSQEIGREERLRNDLFLCRVRRKTLTPLNTGERPSDFASCAKMSKYREMSASPFSYDNVRDLVLPAYF